MFTRTSYSLEISTVQRFIRMYVFMCRASSWPYIRVSVYVSHILDVLQLAALRIRDVCQAKGGGAASLESDARQQLNNCAMHMLICARVSINMYMQFSTDKNCIKNKIFYQKTFLYQYFFKHKHISSNTFPLVSFETN